MTDAPPPPPAPPGTEEVLDVEEASEHDESSEEPEGEAEAAKVDEEYNAWVEDTVPVMYGFVNSTKFKEEDSLFDVCWVPWKGDYTPSSTRYVGNTLGRPSTLLLGGSQGIHITETVVPTDFLTGLHGGDPRSKNYDDTRAITKLIRTIPLPSPAEKLTLLPQNPDVVAVKEQSGSIHVYSKLSEADSCGPRVTLTGHEGRGFGLEFSPFSERVLASGGWDGKVKIWDTTKGDLTNTFTSEKEIGGVSWSKSSPNVLASTGDDNFISLWDTREGSKTPLQRSPVLPTSSSEFFCVTTIAYLPDTTPTFGSYIVTGDTHGQINTWDVRKMETPVLTIEGEGQITCMRWTTGGGDEDKNRVLTGYADGKVELFDLTESTDNTDECLLGTHYGHKAQCEAITSSPSPSMMADGCVASVDGDGIVQVWRFNEMILDPAHGFNDDFEILNASRLFQQ
eukprot:TRINITY_DN17414_c1_g1_i4.p1 TRINITY_DN17414_c1_g1~~TRINITY_DN17414_c1_g1_i4.p1  ORF type:complete len:452 (+),score=93.05 TRINITY_DN17414_c1_g1_i4:40-1395(+)